MCLEREGEEERFVCDKARKIRRPVLEKVLFFAVGTIVRIRAAGGG